MILEVNVDTARLFDGEDSNYELWVSAILDKVHETRRRQDRQANK